MLVDTENLVSDEEFRRDFNRFVAAAKGGNGPVAITRDCEVIGVFLSPDEYDSLFGGAVKKLLKSRETRADHESVRKQAEQAILRRKRS